MNDNGLCSIKETIINTSDLYGPPRSWYSPNLTCSYLFTTSDTNSKLSLEFEHFRIKRLTLCEEDIKLYDGPKSDPFKLINNLCDTNKPLVSILYDNHHLPFFFLSSKTTKKKGKMISCIIQQKKNGAKIYSMTQFVYLLDWII